MPSQKTGIIKVILLSTSLLILAGLIASSVFRLEKEIDSFSLLTKDERYWNSTRVEVELLRLMKQLSVYTATPTPDVLESVQLRMEILWSRINIISQGTTRELIEQVDPGILTEVEKLRLLLLQLEGDTRNLSTGQAYQYLQQMESFIPRFMHSSRTISSAISELESSFALKVQENYRWVVFLLISIVIIAAIFAAMNYLELRRNQKLAREADAANRSKGEFLSNMSHEIRTPLNGILGAVQLLQLENDLQRSPRTRSLLTDITASGEALLNLINNILDLSRLQQKKLQLERQSFSLHECISTARSVINPGLISKNIDFYLQTDPQLPERVCADPLRLQQVLINLLGNAVKFTPSGSITLRIAPADNGQQPPFDYPMDLKAEITDTGIGIPAEVQQQLFSPFTQADSSTTRHYGGSGLGLSLCREIVEAMGGTLGVISEPGKGSTFWFTFTVQQADDTLLQPGNHLPDSTPADLRPIQRAAEAFPSPEPAIEQAPEAHPQSSSEPPGNDPATANRRPPVLIVEDNRVNAKLAQALVRKLGYSTEHAANGAEALQLCRQKHYGLILMDCQMPVMDGLTCSRTLRETPGPNSETPVIALTANVMSIDRNLCLDAGMQEFLTKPVNTAQLKACIDAWYPG